MLVGNLGAGKTTFVRGVARGLGAHGQVSSPTFQLLRWHEGRLPLAHVDLYRIDSPRELQALGLDELLESSVVAVEWADRIPGLAGERTGTVVLSHLGRDTRELRIGSGPPEWSF